MTDWARVRESCLNVLTDHAKVCDKCRHKIEDDGQYVVVSSHCERGCLILGEVELAGSYCAGTVMH